MSGVVVLRGGRDVPAGHYGLGPPHVEAAPVAAVVAVEDGVGHRHHGVVDVAAAAVGLGVVVFEGGGADGDRADEASEPSAAFGGRVVGDDAAGVAGAVLVRGRGDGAGTKTCLLSQSSSKFDAMIPPPYSAVFPWTTMSLRRRLMVLLGLEK